MAAERAGVSWEREAARVRKEAATWKQSYEASHTHHVACVEQRDALRAALREALAIIDEDRTCTKSGWCHDDRVKLERLRALVAES